MSKSVYLVVEGLTEQLFCDRVLAPYLAPKGIFLQASLIRKKGAAGGDVRFDRAKTSIAGYLKQRSDTLVGTFVDYYGLKDWPGLAGLANGEHAPQDIAAALTTATVSAVQALLPEVDVAARFVPFFAVHEFEALLFSSPEQLAAGIGIKTDIVQKVLSECGSPEHINNSPQTAPSKRILLWTDNHYGKTTQGISIASHIGIDIMREKCPSFNAWIVALEAKCK